MILLHNCAASTIHNGDQCDVIMKTIYVDDVLDNRDHVECEAMFQSPVSGIKPCMIYFDYYHSHQLPNCCSTCYEYRCVFWFDLQPSHYEFSLASIFEKNNNNNKCTSNYDGIFFFLSFWNKILEKKGKRSPEQTIIIRKC